MTKITLVLVAALSFAGVGCKKGSDCGGAIAHSLELSKADMAKMPGFDDKMMDKMRALGVQRCTDDKWSAEAVTCMNDAKTEADSQGCYGKLTAEQRDKMNKAAMEMMTPPAAAGAAAAPAAGSAAVPAAGSAAAPAAGSADTAGSGSAAAGGW